MSLAYYIDLETGESSRVSTDGFTEFSERHYVGELQDALSSDGRPPEEILAGLDNDLVLVLHSGLPSQEALKSAENALESSRRVYFHWPRENVIEVVTPERVSSFRLHHKFVNLYWRWRKLQIGRQKKKQEKSILREHRKVERLAASVSIDPANAAQTNPLPAFKNSSKFDFIGRVNGQYIANGRGLYVRLDYWAKLTGGGSYGHTCYQAKALAEASTEGLHSVTASEFALLDDLGIHQIILPSRSDLADEFTLVENGAAYQKAIDGLIDLYRPAYVFERLVLGNATVARACKRAGIPYIAEFNGSELTMSKIFGGREMNNAEVLQSIETESFRHADLISVVSEPVKDEVVKLGIPANKILINPNGVNLDAYGPLPDADRSALRQELGFSEDDVVLGFCGTFGGWHGIEILAEALPRIVAERPDAKFLLIGGGNLKHLVTDAIDAAGISKSVKDVGMIPQQEAARLLAACDIFLSPHSKNMGDRPFFGSPTKLFEYMAYGAGIVCSDLVQLGEVMRPAITLSEKTGERREDARSVLVTPASVEDLIEASLWLIDEPDLRAQLGRNAMMAADKYYSWDVHVQSLWAFALGEPVGGYNEDRNIT